jgi:SAM-dependent methyltransferase
MRAAGWDVAGLEPDPAARAFAESAGLTVSEGPLTTGLFPPESFDAVTMNHVIEHLHEPREVLREIVRVLRPGGTVWVATPNGAALGLARYERRWWPLDPPRHLVLFTPDALRHAFLEAGFAEIVRPPSALLATRWTYRVSSAFARGEADPFGFPGIPRRDLLAAVIADLRTLVRAQDGEELVLGARKAG